MANECNCHGSGAAADKAIQTASRRGEFTCGNEDRIITRMRDMTSEDGKRVRVMRVQVEFQDAGDASRIFDRQGFDKMTEAVAQFIQNHRDEILAMGDEAKKPTDNK
jgi:hypothetical protein